jgi:hypothetical protein
LIDWDPVAAGRAHQIPTLIEWLNSYFAQNPNAAGSFKVEENLTKLFEKYRGKHSRFA